MPKSSGKMDIASACCMLPRVVVFLSNRQIESALTPWIYLPILRSWKISDDHFSSCSVEDGHRAKAFVGFSILLFSKVEVATKEKRLANTLSTIQQSRETVTQRLNVYLTLVVR